MAQVQESPLEVQALSKRFGRLEALRDVNFRVERGEVFGYLGPNGAGKTTTLRIILGLVRATRGSVRLLGQAPRSAASRQDIGFIPGDLRLYGELTAGGLLDFFARFRRARGAPLRDWLLDTLDLDRGTLKRRVKFLSHGTRQKIGLIIAIQHDPALLLLDEPSTGLDPLVQQAFRELVLELASRGRTVLLSSHVLAEVEAVCRRVAILRAGEIVALEEIDALRDKVVRRLAVTFRDAPPPSLADTPGVARCEVRDREAELWVRGDVNPIVRALAGAEVERLVFPEPELEDIFLSYYRAEAEHRA